MTTCPRNCIIIFLISQLNSSTSLTNLESEYLEDDDVSIRSEKVTGGSTSDKQSKGGLESVSNKRMRLANINAWTLCYNDDLLEKKVSTFFPKIFVQNCGRNHIFCDSVQAAARGHVQIQHDLLSCDLALHSHLSDHNFARVRKVPIQNKRITDLEFFLQLYRAFIHLVTDHRVVSHFFNSGHGRRIQKSASAFAEIILDAGAQSTQSHGFYLRRD